ncbi:unnamed protein product [Ostreobium quekettii]|uniref:SAP domain-containing protein n=1 Tax=Ostreobium quekettii TaxID=121088 RepID=A0A8S1IXJ1_9CHLO|nr:unnamed protein product [Ostreobium quekettii]|eukprot:evm.model.scf_198.1 EVM.evm.TU.scf_198.1   scf_198:11685-21232(+)
MHHTVPRCASTPGAEPATRFGAERKRACGPWVRPPRPSRGGPRGKAATARCAIEETETSIDAENTQPESALQDERFAGLRSVLETASELKQEADLDREVRTQRPAARRWDTAKLGLSGLDINEEEEERTAFHRRLFRAAKKGDAKAAENVVDEMMRAGLVPGPKAYHGLIFAYVKAGDAMGALYAIRGAHTSGAQPITESYMVLIHAFVKEDNMKKAEAVLASMLRAGGDAQQGWRMLIASLLHENRLELALIHLEKGWKEKWSADAAVYALLIQSLCKSGNRQRANVELARMQAEGIHVGAQHAQPLMELALKEGDVEELDRLLDAVQEKTVHIFNLLLRGYVNKWDADNIMPRFWQRWEQLSEEAAPDSTSWLLLLHALLKGQDPQAAAKAMVTNMMATQMQGGDQEELMMDILPSMLKQLSREGYPVDIVNLLRALRIDNVHLRPGAFQVSKTGQTFITWWLSDRMDKLKLGDGGHGDGTASSRPEFQALDMSMTSFGGSRVINGVNIGFCSCVVNEKNEIIPVSKLNVGQLKAECQARGLETTGLRKALYDRVKLARRALPLIKEEMRRRSRIRKMQKRAERDRQGGQRPSYFGDADDKGAELVMISFKDGRATSTQAIDEGDLKKVGVVDVDEEGDGAEAQVIEVEDELQQKLKKYKGKGDGSEVVLEEDVPSSVFDLDDDKLDKAPSVANPFTAPSSSDAWLDPVLKAQLVLGNNNTAGSQAALAMISAAQAVGGAPTLADLEVVSHAASVENSVGVAYSISNLVSTQREAYGEGGGKQGERKLTSLLDECARTCVEAGDVKMAEHILDKMEDLGLAPSESLSSRVQTSTAPEEQPDVVDVAATALADDSVDDDDLGALDAEIDEDEEDKDDIGDPEDEGESLLSSVPVADEYEDEEDVEDDGVGDDNDDDDDDEF